MGVIPAKAGIHPNLLTLVHLQLMKIGNVKNPILTFPKVEGERKTDDN
jgi:hypothetical protein